VVGWVRLSSSEAQAYKIGQVLALRFDKFVDEAPTFTLDKDPKLQGALVLIENKTGYVRALVGGSSGEHFQFNRATQAQRQPGSAFKPIIYSAAIEKKSYTPATIVVDEPVTVDLGDREDEEWEPKNAGGGFLGPVSVRTALELSRNICTIKILMDVGIDPVIDLARKMGVTSPLGRNLSLSLGTSEMSLYEITSAYTVFPNGGVYVRPVLVKRIEDRFGNVLEDNTKIPVLDPSEMPLPTPRKEFRDLVGDAPLTEAGGLVKPKIASAQDSPAPVHNNDGEGHPKQGEASTSRVHAALSAQTSYIMTSMLQGGLVRGTGAGIRKILNRKDLAGKKAMDTWFIGFNPDYTAGVWVGFDEKRPIGKREAGGRTALPIWGYLMKDILEKVPEREFPVPPDIVFEQMTTYVGSPKQGFVPGTVTEPVYEPMIGLTLVMNPDDLKEYGTALISGYNVPVGSEPSPSSPAGSPNGQPLNPFYPQYQAPYPPRQSPGGAPGSPQPIVRYGQQVPDPRGPWGSSNQYQPPAHSSPPPAYPPQSSPGVQSFPQQDGKLHEQPSAVSVSPQPPRLPDVEQQPQMRPYYPEQEPR
jgi:membrane carboxypeptidase/penicillin-binding protein